MQLGFTDSLQHRVHINLRLQTSDFEDALSAGLRGREGFDGAVKGVPPLPSLVDDEQRLEA